jgi:hypothetical protein
MVAAGAAAAEIGPASLAREPVVLIEKYRLFTGPTVSPAHSMRGSPGPQVEPIAFPFSGESSD